MKLEILLTSLWVVITICSVHYIFYQYLVEKLKDKNKELQSMVTNLMLMHDDQEQMQADVTILKTDAIINFQKIQKDLEKIYEHLEISIVPEKKRQAKVLKKDV